MAFRPYDEHAHVADTSAAGHACVALRCACAHRRTRSRPPNLLRRFSSGQRAISPPRRGRGLRSAMALWRLALALLALCARRADGTSAGPGSCSGCVAAPAGSACAPGAQGWRADTAHALTPPCPLTPPRLCAQAERWARPRAVGQRIPLHGAFGGAQQRKRVCGTAAPAGGSADLVPCSRARSLAQASSPLVQNVPVTITLSGSADFKGFLALKPSTCVPPQTGCRAPRCADQRYPIHSACAAARLAR